MLMTIENMKDELLELNRLREEATDPARKQELSHTIRIMTQKLNQRYSIMTASVPHVNRIY